MTGTGPTATDAAATWPSHLRWWREVAVGAVFGVQFAAAVALAALAARTGIDAPVRVVAGTLMFAVIYLAIGTIVDRIATRALPTHFVTLWMVDLSSGHGGRIGDLGWALAATIAAVAAAWSVAAARTRTARTRSHRARPGGVAAQLAAASRAAWRDARRNPALWVLFVVVPVVFIITADAVTPNEPIILTVTEYGHRVARTFAMPKMHGATMAPIAVASLAALVGLFAVLDSRDGDRRAVLAGLRAGTLLSARLGVLAVAALGATAVSLAATALVFDATPNRPACRGCCRATAAPGSCSTGR